MLPCTGSESRLHGRKAASPEEKPKPSSPPSWVNTRCGHDRAAELRDCLSAEPVNRSCHFNFIFAQDHRVVAKRSDAVLPGMARSYSPPVRRISRSFSSGTNLARLGLEFYRGGNRRMLVEHADCSGELRVRECRDYDQESAT